MTNFCKAGPKPKIELVVENLFQFDITQGPEGLEMAPRESRITLIISKTKSQ